MLSYLLLLLELAALAISAYIGRRRILRALRNSTRSDFDEAYDVDTQILHYLRGRGGVAYQVDIVKDLELPKSTVHKALKRLAEKGLVEIRRQGKANMVTLKEATLS